MSKVLLICLPEATFDLIGPWVEAGYLKTLGDWMSEGCRGSSTYGIPYLMTPQMWATVFSGRSAGSHGVFDYWQRGPDGRFFETRGRDIQVPPIWRTLSERGISSGIVNVPWTFPPDQIKGFMISGQDAPGAHPSIASPRSLYTELRRRFGRYRLKDIFPGGQSKDKYADTVLSETRWQTDVFEYLVSSQDWRFFVCYFPGTAMAQHYFWGDMVSEEPSAPHRHVVRDTYRVLDESLARLREAAGPDTTVFVISDCGAGPLRFGVQVNTWLAQEGFLKFKYSYADSSGRAAKLVREFLAGVRKNAHRLLPKAAFYRANRSKLRPWIQQRLAFSDIDWGQTKVFYRGKGEGNLYVNLKGRDPHGIVSPGAEYDALCQRVVERLKEIRDPLTGERAVVEVHFAKDLYSGPRLAWAPDLIVEWRDTAFMPSESDRRKDRIFAERWREYMNWPTTGCHRMPGVFVATGPGVTRGAEIGDCRLLDLAPTFFRALGEVPPESLEGTVIDGLFDPARVQL